MTTRLSDPLVSIITPYRNSEEFLPSLALNLQAQTYPHWECILIDHHSSDLGPKIAIELARRDNRFHSIRESDPRPLPALPRNTGLAKARGELICFLDVDDLWHPLKLERQLLFHTCNNLEFSVTSYGRFRGDHAAGNGLLPRQWRPWYPPKSMSRSRLLWDNPIPMLTVMLNKELLSGEEHAGGPFALVHHEDYLLWLTLWLNYPDLRYGRLDEVLAFHRRHKRSITASRWRMAAWTYGVHRAHGESIAGAALRSARLGVVHLSRSASSWLFASNG